MVVTVPQLKNDYNYELCLSLILRQRCAVDRLAKYVHDVLQIYKRHEIYIVDFSLYQSDFIQRPVSSDNSENKFFLFFWFHLQLSNGTRWFYYFLKKNLEISRLGFVPVWFSFS
jgi:hypothetical protein